MLHIGIKQENKTANLDQIVFLISETDFKVSNFLFFLKTKSQCVAQAVPVLLGSSDPCEPSNWYTGTVLTPIWRVMC